MLSDEWLPRYRLLENFTAKWNGNGNGNVYDRGDYNSSFALRAVKLKNKIDRPLLTPSDHKTFCGFDYCLGGGGGKKWAGPFLPHPQNQVKAKYFYFCIISYV